MPGFPVHHHLPEPTQTNVDRIGDAIQPSHPLSSCSPPAFNHLQHQGLFRRVGSSHQVAKWLSFNFSISSSNEYSGQIIFRMDWLDLLECRGLLNVFSNTTVQKQQFIGTQLSLWSKSHIHAWLLENHSLDWTDLLVMSLLFKMLSRLVKEQQTGSKYRKEYVKAVYCHPAYLTYMQSTSWEMLGWEMKKWSTSWNQDFQENINKLRYANDTTLIAESKELKILLMKVKEESKNAGLKLNIQKTKTMASGPSTSWQIDGETVETVTDFILLGFKITAEWWLSHEIKRCLLLGRKAIAILESILKGRDITLSTKVHLVKAMVFPVVTYGC